MRYSTTPFSLSRVTGPISEHKGEGVHFVPIRQHIAPERKMTAGGLLRALEGAFRILSNTDTTTGPSAFMIDRQSSRAGCVCKILRVLPIGTVDRP